MWSDKFDKVLKIISIILIAINIILLILKIVLSLYDNAFYNVIIIVVQIICLYADRDNK